MSQDPKTLPDAHGIGNKGLFILDSCNLIILQGSNVLFRGSYHPIRTAGLSIGD